MLLVLQEWGLLKYHVVGNPHYRGNVLVHRRRPDRSPREVFQRRVNRAYNHTAPLEIDDERTRWIIICHHESSLNPAR
jgi:hypothetical protein